MAVSIVNQWAATFTQPISFGTTPPALESVVLALTAGNSVGGGSGTPTAGNWLVTLVAMNEHVTTAGFTVAVNDDVRSFWHPGNENTSTWAVSTGTALTRTAIWYTANPARAAGNVYIAPNGIFDALAVLVIEVSGMGPWDTVTAINTNYAAAATSLSLSLGAPSASALVIGAVTGDSTAAGQAFAPGGWTALHTTSVTNGVDHTCDAVLTSAYIVTSGSVAVSGTATSATDLSGVLIGFLATGTSPVPATQNPSWPYMKFEAAFGGGFLTPPDQLTWTDLTSRLWAWDETTGIQFQLGQIQATNVEMELDNFDGNLSSDNSSSPYYPHILTGTPVRIRAALATMGGVSFNRWYCIKRNIQEWPQQITEVYRRFSPATATDIWSTFSSFGPSPYRGEVEQDFPYAWWAMDDQPLAGGVQPTSLRNSAIGNTNVLTVQAASGGVTAGDAYSTTGTDLTALSVNIVTPQPPGVAIYAVGQQAGWMYGDPMCSPQSMPQATGPVSSQPGSAAWQQTGLAGNTGGNGWFLTCNDASFPGLSSGVSFGIWWNSAFFGTATGYTDRAANAFDVAGQPYSNVTIAELATATAPVAVLQMDRATGHLNLITYNGGTGTSHSIYSSSDLRSASWQHVMLTTDGNNWNVYVNGGLTASVSGTGAGMTSAWNWLIIGADLGTGGGGTLSGAVNMSNTAFAHAEVYPSVLPPWRILAHYCAAITAFGLLPAPQAITLSSVINKLGGISYVPDGTEFNGNYGLSGTTIVAYSLSAVAASQAGSFTSGPSARGVIAGLGQTIGGTNEGNAVWVGWSAVAPQVLVYTAAGANSETNAATTTGSGDSFTTGYGSGASGHGVCQTAAGSGASPPTSASALGDTVQQRIERILSYGNATYPGRCIDNAALAVQAATDICGQQVGANLQNVANSDGGMLYVDSQGNLTYWQKSHLAAQFSSPAWTLGPAASGASVIPYDRRINWMADPQRVWNAVQISPFSPDGASLPVITPSTTATSIISSQKQYGAQPFQVTNYLQSTTEMQNQANWIFSNFGQVQIRVENLQVDAAAYNAGWQMLLQASVGDVVSIQNWQIGGGGVTGTFRISQIRRRIRFAGQNGEVEAAIEIIADFEPSSYWS